MFDLKAPVTAGILGAALVLGGAATAETRVTLKSASSASSYYVMMVQLGEVEGDIETMAVPVGAYATNMDDDTALAIVSAFWEQRDVMAETNPWWAGVTPDLVPQLGAPLHEGVADYYAERGVSME